MLTQLIFRMMIGGAVVSGFALVSDVLKPKRFAGLFGAAPSVALATLALAAATKGELYAAIEARSMIAGAAALILYCYFVFRMMLRAKYSALSVALSSICVWFAAALGIWYAFFAPSR